SNVDVMKRKQVSRVLLNKDAVVNRRLADADGGVLSEMQINTSLLSYDVLNRRMVIPRPGTMLVRDHRPPDEKKKDKPGAGGAEAEKKDGLSTQRGATVFQWADSLDYNGPANRATMKGDVVVVYKPDADSEP